MRKKLLIALLSLAAMGAGGAALIRLAGAGATEFRVAGDVLHISGPISGAASDRLERMLDQTPGLVTVALGDIPGADDVAWVTGMGRMIRAEGLTTRAEGRVVNDAIFLFLGGVDRVMAGGALVLQGDAAQRQAGVGVDVSAAASADRERFVAAMLGDTGFATFMAETRAAGASYVLSDEDVMRYGLQTVN
jgi:hypothetical protein